MKGKNRIGPYKSLGFYWLFKKENANPEKN